MNRLIEVALPIREISAESVRDKSLRHGHISTLHLWWARRPLAASRAVVFASLVPDPDDLSCPREFREAVLRLLRDDVPQALKGYWRGRKRRQDPDPYRPYEDIPDTPRNRLLTFIAKWSPEWLAFEKGEEGSQQPVPAELLDDRSLVKWETSNPENEQGREVLRIARELIQLAVSSSQFSDGANSKLKTENSKLVTVLDPFAGGGAIPLEATRLGCQAIANDYNPVAYLILRATCEFPQRFGQLPVDSLQFSVNSSQSAESPQLALGGELETEPPKLKTRNSKLATDVEHWAKWILERARERIGQLYPAGKDGKPVVGYLWARTAPCSNPACRAEIPLLRSLLVCNKSGKRVALTMTRTSGHSEPAANRHSERSEESLSRKTETLRREAAQGDKTVVFGIAKNKDIVETDGTMLRLGDCRCPICQQVTPVEDLRRAGLEGKMGERMVAVITDTPQGKDYRPVESADLQAFEQARQLAETVERPNEAILPEITGNDDEDISNSTGIRVHLYGMKTWGSLFNPRQLLAMQTFIACLRDMLAELEQCEPDVDYRKAVSAYLGLWVSKYLMNSTCVGLWKNYGEYMIPPFANQAIPMVWDYPEGHPFTEGTGGILTQLEWVLRVIDHETPSPESALCITRVLCGDGASLQLANDAVDSVVTDPPYFDAIAYADLSDFFYVWLKRSLGDVFPEVFVTPLTPKSGEATALKHRHDSDGDKAKLHFTSKLAACLAEAKRVCKPDGVLAVMFAHQSTEAWTALINAVLDAGLNVTATYPIDTEWTTRRSALEPILKLSFGRP
jgi:adenine-specific DNA methylase